MDAGENVGRGWPLCYQRLLTKEESFQGKVGSGYCNLPLGFSDNVKTKSHTDGFFKNLKATAAKLGRERGHSCDSQCWPRFCNHDNI